MVVVVVVMVVVVVVGVVVVSTHSTQIWHSPIYTRCDLFTSIYGTIHCFFLQ